MKGFLTVLKFELGNYFEKKGFMISTGIIALAMVVILSIPSIFDCSKLIPGLGGKSAEKVVENNVEEGDKTKYAILDENKIIKDKSILPVVINDSEWQEVASVEELEKLVNNEEVKGGIKVDSLRSYSYYVINSSFTDSTQAKFNAVLSQLYKEDALTKAGLNIKEIDSIYNTPIESQVQVLGKDNANNFVYAYILLFVVYMMILMYGQTIAMAVAAEKSNRAIEVLVTSTSTNSLIFGKVIAGAIASVFQVGVVMGAGILGYQLNSETWNGKLDMIFNIPGNLLITFILFGLVGYLFYAFLFGALGALVSKTEDIGTSIGPVMLVFVGVFMLCMFGLGNSDSMLIKVASFIPFSSPMAMIVRVALGTVSNVEIGISFMILAVSTVLAGMGGAKIYRLATLMYGNPIKFTNALKWLKKSNN